MVNLKINGIDITVEDGTTILSAARQAGIEIPTLCFMKEINEISACRVCVVEVKGIDRLVAACTSSVFEGMEVLTNSPKARAARRTNVELILSQHDSHCTTCVRSGNCALQKISNDLGLIAMPYKADVKPTKWDKSFPLIRNNAKCIKCMRCINVCDKVQTLGVWDIIGTGSRTSVNVAGGKSIRESDCSLCGQCITHCPVGALRERDDTDKVFDALADENKITVVQIAPAVRAAWGESLGLERDDATVNRLVAALRKAGFKYIFDTDFTADLTIMEEGSELVERLTHPESNALPMFTSCCPGWVRFLKSQYPDMTPNLSTAKSPQQMFGAVAKSYYAELLGVEAEKLFCVSVMPCTAKKHECDLETMQSAGAGKDVDIVLTTREIDRLIKACGVDVAMLGEEEFDRPLGIATGAGIIFGSTGGVMEAALRSAYYLISGKNPPVEAFTAVRENGKAWRSAEYDIGDTHLRVAVASGLGNARKLVEAIRSGEEKYDFVEIMACPGGCGGGGGQPICDGFELAPIRTAKLYELDRNAPLRFSHENPAITEIYAKFLGKPLSEKSHHLLHTDHDAWQLG